MEEIWKDVVGYEGLYQVSNYGEIRSPTRISRMPVNGNAATKTVKGRVIKTYCSGKTGYRKVALAKDGNTRKFFVHRIVAQAFLENPNSYPVVNHIDGDKGNNVCTNLEWCTQKHNLEHAVEAGLRKPKKWNVSVQQYDTDGNLLRVWNGYSEVHKKLGYCIQNVWKCAHGKTKTAYGCVWRFERTGGGGE